MIVLAAAFSRLIPHPWNFTAIGAMALFGGASFRSKTLSLVLPVAALFLSDLVLGLHSTMVFVYAAFVLIGILGWSLQEKKTALRVGTYALASSAIFFLVSNFGVWMTQALYPHNGAGLVECYVAALPFLQNQVLGDLFYSAILFGGFAFASRRVPALARA